MTQMQLNVTFDLGTAEGRAEFQRMCGHLLKVDAQVEVKSSVVEEEGYPGSLVPPARANASSAPDDADRAAAALAGRQAAAAKARAAKAAKAGTAPGPETVIEDPAPNGAAEDDLGLTDPNMSPAEAKEAGLALVREAFQAGKIAQVKALQKAWGIAKFYDVPNERGHEFYQQVMKLAHETGLRK
jgi:hypothetical protein